MSLRLGISVDAFALYNAFTISRGSRNQAIVVTATVGDGTFSGRGECTPYPRYGESVGSVVQSIEDQRQNIQNGLTREDLQALMKPGAARNALDCAFWDYEAKKNKTSVVELAHIKPVQSVVTAYTISLDTVENMYRRASEEAHRPLLKIKLGSGESDIERIMAIRQAAPNSQLIADANEGWSGEYLQEHINACEESNYALVEQPVPAKDDEVLRHIKKKFIKICADESVHDRKTLGRLSGLYNTINIKLDKTGGLTEALKLIQEAQKHEFSIMVGSMLCTSLGIAPAMLLTPFADFSDLDSPLLVKEDRTDPIRYENGLLFPPLPSLWG